MLLKMSTITNDSLCYLNATNVLFFAVGMLSLKVLPLLQLKLHFNQVVQFSLVQVSMPNAGKGGWGKKGAGKKLICNIPLFGTPLFEGTEMELVTLLIVC